MELGEKNYVSFVDRGNSFKIFDCEGKPGKSGPNSFAIERPIISSREIFRIV